MLEKNHNQTTRLAVLIDADNANPNAIEILLKEIATYGTANVFTKGEHIFKIFGL